MFMLRAAVFAAAAWQVAGQEDGSSFSFAKSAGRTQVNSDLTGVVPGRYIVEVHPDAVKGRRGESGVESVVQDMQAKGYSAAVKEDYGTVSTRFHGGSIEVNVTESSDSKKPTSSAASGNSSVADEILALPAVANVWPVHIVTLNASMEVVDSTNQAKWTPHAATRVSALHAAGLQGKGQTVCLVDSGVDATHPALKGRIAGGKNMLDGSDNFADGCVGHGTFVSSQIVGVAPGLEGVAPEAKVYMYRVFGDCDYTTTTDLVIKGLLAADADNCDIVSASLGSGGGFRDGVTSRIAAEIAADRLMIVAAGNDGAQGPFYASAPAVGAGVLSVGSVEAAQVLAWPAQLIASDGSTFDVAYTTPTGNRFNGSIDVAVDRDAGDSCNFVGSTTDEDKAVLVRRGVCAERYAARAGEAAGYQYMLIFDSYDQGVFYADDVADYYYGPLQLFANTAARVGEWAAARNGSSLRLVIKADAQAVATDSIDLQDIPQAGQVSSTSSWGASYENDVSPQVLAPGGSVFGASPGGKIAIGSGTSFSAPYVAGVAALIYANGNKDKEDFKRRLISTSHALPAYNELVAKIVSVGVNGPVAQQGAGLIDVESAFLNKGGVTIVSNPVLHLNDTDNRVNTFTIQLRNDGTKAVTFNITHVPSVSVQSRNILLYPYAYYPPLVDGVYGSLQAPSTVRIAAGATADVSVTFAAPPNVDETLGLVWSGKVVFASDAQQLSLPYFAVEASTYNWGPLHHGPESYYYNTDDGVLYPVDYLGKSQPYKPLEGFSPETYFALRYGTYELSIDIVGDEYDPESDFVYPPVAAVGPRAWYGAIRQQADPSYTPTDFPMLEVARFSQSGFVTFHSLANGTAIPSGRYRVLSRTLRIFGDATNPKDWQLFLSDPFWIQNGDDPLPESNSTVSSSSASSSVASSTASSADVSPTSFSTVVTSSTSVPLPTFSTMSLGNSTIVAPTSVPPTTVTSVPGTTTTLTPTSTPTGIADGFAKLELQRYQEASNAFPDTAVWMELHIVVEVADPTPSSASIQFAVPPEIVDFPTDQYLQASGGFAGYFNFDSDSHIASIDFTDWTTWHKNIQGDFYVMCRFTSEFASSMVPGTYVPEFTVVTSSGLKNIASPIYHTAVDRSQVYEHLETVPYAPNSGQLFVADIEVPASLGPWQVIQLQAVLTSDDGFICDESGVYIGYASLCPSDGNRMTNATTLKDFSDIAFSTTDNARCAVKTYYARYEAGLDGPRHVMRFRVAGIQGQSTQWTYGFTYALDVVLTNGTVVLYDYKTINFEKYARKRSTNFYEFSGDRS